MITSGVGMMQMAMGPSIDLRGHAASAVVKSTGETVGGYLGAGSGTMLYGPPGEIIGGFVGAEIGGVAAKAVDFAKGIFDQSRLLHFGHYQDTEVAYTQRQRAVQKMGRSALNARPWLGKESVLMHT